MEVRPEAMNGALLELYRHKTWATLRLIEYCQGLEDEHLDATIPGTFGTMRDTLRHLIGAEVGSEITVRAYAESAGLMEQLPQPAGD